MTSKAQTNRKTEKIYQYIKDYIDHFKYPPTYREIRNALGLSSTSVVTFYIKRLIQQKRIGKFENKARTLYIIEQEQDDNE